MNIKILKKLMLEHKVFTAFSFLVGLITILMVVFMIYCQFHYLYPPLTTCYSNNDLPYHYAECHNQGQWTMLDNLTNAIIFSIIGLLAFCNSISNPKEPSFIMHSLMLIGLACIGFIIAIGVYYLMVYFGLRT